MKNEKWILLTLALVQFTNIMDFMIMMPLGPQLMRIMEMGPQAFSAVVSSYTISAGICGFLGAFLIDRFDRKKALRFAYTGFTLGTLCCGLAPDYISLMAARVLTGAFGGVLGALVLSIVGDLIPAERRGRAMGTVMLAFSAASVFGVPFGLFLANSFNWNAPFLFLALFSLFVGLLIERNIPPVRNHLQPAQAKPTPIQVIRAVSSDRNQLRALAMMACLMLGQFSVIPFLSPYMVANVGFTEQQLPYIYLFGGIATMVSMPLIGKLTDKHGKLRMFTIGIFTSSIPLILITHLPQVPLALALCVTTVFMIFISARMVPASALSTSVAPPASRGSFMSFQSSVQQLFSGIASLISGAVVVKSQTGPLLHYNWVGAMAVAFGFMALFLARKVVSVS
jgi:predicted MFS family arabinose efflux permease